MIDGVMSLWLSLFVSLVFLLLKVERGQGGERDLCEDVCDLRVACGGGVPKRSEERRCVLQEEIGVCSCVLSLSFLLPLACLGN